VLSVPCEASTNSNQRHAVCWPGHANVSGTGHVNRQHACIPVGVAAEGVNKAGLWKDGSTVRTPFTREQRSGCNLGMFCGMSRGAWVGCQVP
jgi:hypothetical protein